MAAPTNLFEDTDSELSEPPSSPPPECRYPSPPTSQVSLTDSPTPSPDTTPRKRASPNGKTESPAKRRRVTETMPRETKYLDLYEENLDTPNTDELERLVKALRTKKKIVVVAGAGISVSVGIPDFRSSTGLFTTLKRENNLKSSGKELFDASVYREESSITAFHSMVRSLSEQTKEAQPTRFHQLIARLAQEDRLLRLYSQNVDGIDISLQPLATQVPLPSKGPWPKTVQLHGGLAKMSCTKCHHVFDFEAELFEGPVPPACSNCTDLDHLRTSVAGKRSHGIGRLRPRMVLYNEHNPDDEAIGAVTRADLRTRPDAIIVVGTSLKIPGVRRIVREMCGIVRDRRDGLAVWINEDPEPSGKEFENCWDLVVKGQCDDVAKHAGLPNWDDDIIGEWQKVTKEEVEQARERNNPKVILTTPSKQRTIDYGLLSPCNSPHPSIEVSRLSFEIQQAQYPGSVKNERQLAASKGRQISDILGLGTKAPPKKAAKKRTLSAAAKATAVKPAQKSLSFAVTKKGAAVTQRAEPGKGIKLISLKGKAAPKSTVLEPISPSAARNNSGLPFKSSASKAVPKALLSIPDELCA